MHHVTEMLTAHPQAGPSEELARCIGACFACAQACTSCADACLAEKDVQGLVRCIRLDLDCADVCEVTGRVLTRQTDVDPTLVRAMLEACVLACRACADECERHATEMKMEHCRLCGEACRRCERACGSVLDSISAP